jgi:PAS domain S-box-containing protein
MRSTEIILGEIEKAFGFVPPMYLPLQDNPLQLDNLWQQTLKAYAQNPLPALFKEKLAAYLSRFCEVPYCIVCHSCAVHALGVSGDAIMKLLAAAPPLRSDLETQFRRLQAVGTPVERFPEPGSYEESLLIDASALIYLDEDDGSIRRELRRLLDNESLQSLLAMISFVKTVHHLMQSYPDVAYESDLRAANHLDSLARQEMRLTEFFKAYGAKVREEREVRSGRRRDAERLRESEQRFRSLIEATTRIVWRVDDLGKPLEIGGWEEYTGQTEAEARAGGWMEFVHPDERATVEQSWGAGLSGVEAFSFECRLRRRDNRYAYFATNVVPVRRPDGTIWEWVGASADIDARKRAESALSAAHERQQTIANALQRSLLIVPPDNAFPGMAFHTVYEPATDEANVGGDFYDIFELDDNRVALFVGDVSGKGLEAAALTAEVKFTLRAYLREDSRAAPALRRLNRFLVETRKAFAWRETAFVCLALAVLDTVTGVVEFAVAGAEPPLIARGDGSMEEIQVSDLPLGVVRDVEYASDALLLGERDMLILATDGLAEARQDDGMLGSEGVRLLVESALLRMDSLPKIGDAILTGARAYSGGILRDDVCLLLARRR